MFCPSIKVFQWSHTVNIDSISRASDDEKSYFEEQDGGCMFYHKPIKYKESLFLHYLSDSLYVPTLFCVLSLKVLDLFCTSLWELLKVSYAKNYG